MKEVEVLAWDNFIHGSGPCKQVESEPDSVETLKMDVAVHVQRRKNTVNGILNIEWTVEEEGINSDWERRRQWVRVRFTKVWTKSERVFALRSITSEEEIALVLHHTSHEKTHSYLSFMEPGKSLASPSICLRPKG